jgi:hypothetical protein
VSPFVRLDHSANLIGRMAGNAVSAGFEFERGALEVVVDGR